VPVTNTVTFEQGALW